MEDLVDRLNILIGRRMENNDDRTNEADSAAQSTQRPQLFAQKVGP